MSATLSPLFSWRGQIAGSKLHSTTKLVAFTLSLHMSERGDSCFPSIETLADETSLHYDTVKDHLTKLAALGWITKTYDRSVKGRGTRVYYAAAVPTTGAEAPPAPSETVDETPDQGGAAPSSNGVENPPPVESVNESASKNDATRRADRSAVEPTSRCRAERDELYQAIVSACGMVYGEMTKRQQRACAVAMSELAEVGATPAEVHRRASIYPQKYHTVLTPNALANQWAALRVEGGPPQARGETAMDQALAMMASRRANVVELRAVGQ